MKLAAYGIALSALAATPALAQDKTIDLGWTAWSDAEVITRMAAQILEEKMGYKVNMQLADIAIQYQGVANCDLDAMLMAWLPETHKDYVERFKEDLDDVGVLYGGARLGWVVPDYIPEDQLSSIADLNKEGMADKFDERIQGIDPGAGLMRLSQQAMEDYDLDDYTLVSASGAGMTAALDRAIRRDEWIVATGWSPHWMFGKHDLRYLEDPKGTLGGEEQVHVMACQQLKEEHPEVYGFLSRMKLNIDDLQATMAAAEETSYEEAVSNYISEHQDLVNYWVTGEGKPEA